MISRICIYVIVCTLFTNVNANQIGEKNPNEVQEQTNQIGINDDEYDDTKTATTKYLFISPKKKFFFFKFYLRNILIS